jgi:glyoxylase-like metal-dependent hydrolase (beta-lactamase superfamily II)
MSKTSATIQMYRLNELGDCFLITFTAETQSSRMLIDCGSFRNGKDSIGRIKQIIAEIGTAVDGKGLDVVVGTHQHNDHVSGFVHGEKEFRKIGIGQVWLSWLDDPADKTAQAIGADHHNLKLHLARARILLTTQLKGRTGARPLAARSLEVLNDILGFYGANAAGMPAELPAEGCRS